MNRRERARQEALELGRQAHQAMSDADAAKPPKPKPVVTYEFEFGEKALYHWRLVDGVERELTIIHYDDVRHLELSKRYFTADHDIPAHINVERVAAPAWQYGVLHVHLDGENLEAHFAELCDYVAPGWKRRMGVPL